MYREKPGWEKTYTTAIPGLRPYFLFFSVLVYLSLVLVSMVLMVYLDDKPPLDQSRLSSFVAVSQVVPRKS